MNDYSAFPKLKSSRYTSVRRVGKALNLSMQAQNWLEAVRINFADARSNILRATVCDSSHLSHLFCTPAIDAKTKPSLMLGKDHVMFMP